MFSQIIHPGHYIQDIIENTGTNLKDVSSQLGITEDHLDTIIAGKNNIDLKICIGLAKIFGGSIDYWKKLQEHSIKKEAHLEHASLKIGEIFSVV